MASLLRRIYLDGPVGVNRLRTWYGGRKDRGARPERFRRGSGAIVRKGLQQLEKLGFVEKTDEGRIITPEGRSFLDKLSHKIKKKIPELSKY